MLVNLHGERAVILDLPAEVTWASAQGQSFGSASIRILRDSIAWDAEIISEHGGVLVEIITAVGTWRGIGDTPVYRTDGMAIQALHLNSWTRIRHVASHRLFCGVSAGVIVKRAVQDALVGLGSVPVTIGPILHAPPVIADYTFKGQTFLSVLTDMQNKTGQVWTITDALEFTWRSQIGRYRELTLIDDGRYLDRLQRQPLADQIAETIEIEPNGRTFTAYDHGVPALWPSQQIVRV